MEKEINIIEGLIEEIAETAATGEDYWRASYTAQDKECAALLKRKMEERGLKTYFDEVGNLFGRIDGKKDKTVLLLSHRDTVKNGGKFDGVLGIATALEAVSCLLKKKGTPEKTVEVAALCEEEGSRFLSGYIGSRGVVGKLTEDDLENKDEEGITLKEALISSGYYKGRLPSKRQDIERTVELHIEQGNVLESRGKTIGIVSGIVGMLVGTVTFTGKQGHAGTTPMSLRDDPVPSAALFIKEMIDWARTKGDEMVCTIGSVRVKPGNSNVIPEKIILTFDIRSDREELLLEAKRKINDFKGEKDGKILKEVEYSCEEKPTPMDGEGLEILKSLAEKGNMKYMLINSGAGHDSQIFARQYKSNMIFVPSKGGISHSPLEYTEPEDIETGYGLLKKYIECMAW